MGAQFIVLKSSTYNCTYESCISKGIKMVCGGGGLGLKMYVDRVGRIIYILKVIKQLDNTAQRRIL